MPRDGDFIKVAIGEDRNAYGVFESREVGQNPTVSLVVYDGGLPYAMKKLSAAFPEMPGHIPNCPNLAEVISADEFVSHLEKARERFGKKADSKDLVGACWQSRMYSLDSVIKKIREFGAMLPGFFPETPSTGIYVVHALPKPSSNPSVCGEAPENQTLQGIKVNPVLPPDTVSFVLSYTHPTGFGGLRTEQYERSIGNSYFFAYAIPEEAVGYVKSPLEFNFNPQEGAKPKKKAAKKKVPKKKKAKKKR